VNTTTVASGGKLVIGGVDVTLTGAVTLQGLADKINSTSKIGVQASIVSPTNGKYQLVLTSLETGVANAFTVDTRGLTGSTVAFTDTDGDGISGDSTADNRMQALNAQVLVNNVAVSSASNTIKDAIPGVTLTLLRKKPDVTVGVSVTSTSDTTQSAIKTFVSTFNALSTFVKQQTASGGGLVRDPLLRSLQTELRDMLSANVGDGDHATSLAAAGIGFSADGTLTLDSTVFTAAVADHEADVKTLFLGSGSTTGIFQQFSDTIKKYTDTGALLSSAQDRIDSQIQSLDSRLASMQERLDNRRASLQQEMTAADLTITQLKSQSGSLSSLSSSLTSF
jgi:flagellar hook-associated protein 2